MEETTKRSVDLNGWVEIKDNPISKEGVFQYSGAQISDKLIPDKIYNVYRPAEELSSPECIKSFRLIPWTDEHAMLGGGENDPAAVGIEGVIGEDVYYKDGYLKANIKVFTQKLASLIEKGKKELSIGYKCAYDVISGTFNGVKYDAIQRKIRGNHVALVYEGRSGSDVSVLDQFVFTIDTKELLSMSSEEKEMSTKKEEDLTLLKLAETVAKLTDSIDEIKSQIDEMSNYKASDEDEEEKEVEVEIEVEKESEGEDKDEEENKSNAMDSKIKTLEKRLSNYEKGGMKSLLKAVSDRDNLARDLSKVVGTFDHAEMTAEDVASYGVKKLSLDCKEGHEVSALKAYFKASSSESRKKDTFALDSGSANGKLRNFLKGVK